MREKERGVQCLEVQFHDAEQQEVERAAAEPPRDWGKSSRPDPLLAAWQSRDRLDERRERGYSGELQEARTSWSH
jgi:hypothetical protein